MILAEQNFDLRTKSVPDEKNTPEEENQALADAEANAAFQKLYEAVHEGNSSHFKKGLTIPEWALGKALQKFLRERGSGKVEKWKWLEGRKTPLLDHLAPCHTIDLPNDYEPTDDDHNRRTFANIPHIPPLEFWREAIPTHWEAVTPTDNAVLEQIAQHVIPILKKITPNASITKDTAEAANQYALWANGTKLDMVTWIRSCFASGFERVVENGSFKQLEFKGKSENSLYIPNIFDLNAEVVACRTNIDKWLESKKTQTFFSREESFEYKKIIDQLMAVIECCRWRIDHDAMLPGLTNCLQTAYALLGQAIELNINDVDYLNSAKRLNHDFACLVAGGRADTNAANQPDIRPQFALDYVDVFMLLAQQFSPSPYTEQVTEYQIPRLKIFQQIDAGAQSPIQLYACLLATYIRMDVSQRQRYEPVIKKIFEQVQAQLPTTFAEPLLYVPNTHIKNKKNNQLFGDLDLTNPKNFMAAFQRTQLHWSELVDTKPGFDAFSRRNNAKIDIRTTVKSDGSPKTILGENTSHLRLIEDTYWGAGSDLGYAFTEEEAMIPLEDPPEIAFLSRLEPAELLAAIDTMPGLLSTKRLGTEFELMSNELIGRRAEAGSFINVSEIFALIELLTTLTDQPTPVDFTDVVLRISSLAECLADDELGDDLTEILAKAKEIQAMYFNHDKTTHVTLSLMATGLIPRELLVEFSLKAYDVLVKLLGVTTAAHLAVAEKARLIKLFGPEMAEHSFDLRTFKTELHTLVKNLRAQHGYEYDLNLSADFQKKVTEMLDVVASLLNKNVVYDEDMHTGLRAIIAMQRTGRLEVQCSANADLLLSLATFLSQEIPLYHASTYGDESMLNTDQWLAYISQIAKKKDYSHAFGQIDWPLPGKETGRYLVVDGTAGGSNLHKESARKWLPERSRLMKSGHAANGLTIYDRNIGKIVFGTAIHQGSAVIASFAIEAEQIDYAYAANPDDMNILLTLLTTSKLLKNNEKLDILLKLISMEPKILAKCMDTTYRTGDTTATLAAVAELAIHNKLWSVACFTTNILRFSDLIKPEDQKRADKLYGDIVTIIINLPEPEYVAALSNLSELFSSADKQFIADSRKLALEGKSKLAQVKSRISAEVTAIRKDGISLAFLQFLMKLMRGERSLGDQFKATIKEEVARVSAEAKKEVVGEFAGVAASTRFEEIKLIPQVSALKKLLSNTKSPAEVTARLQMILQNCAAVSLEIAVKDTRQRCQLLAAETNQQISDAALTATSLQVAMRQFDQFREGLQKAATELALELPQLDAKILLTHTLRAKQLPMPNTDTTEVVN